MTFAQMLNPLCIIYAHILVACCCSTLSSFNRRGEPDTHPQDTREECPYMSRCCLKFCKVIGIDSDTLPE